jgi:hypothetical protein
MIQPVHVSRVLHKKHHAEDAAATPATSAPAEEEEEEEAADATPAPAPSKKPKKKAAEETEEEAPAPAPTKAPKPTTTAPAPVPTTAAAPAATTAAPAADDEEETPAPSKKHKKTAAPAADEEAADTPAPTPGKSVNDKRIKGDKNEGVIDGSSEGSAEIDKIDLRNEEKWVSVYNDPPLLVIKASLYAFISYNNSDICDTFNMSLNAVEQKADANGSYQYHVVTYINCTKNGVDETPGRFILNFIPEGKRLLLTECGHREEGEIVNWLKIVDEVPECMTPAGRKKFLAQPMKHIHANNGTDSNAAPKETNFFARLEELDGEEVAIAGSATVALIAVIVVIAVFIMRKRKAQKDLERTIAGAKADHADDDEEKGDDDKNLVDAKKKSGEDEGSFVNSPAVKV